MAGLGVGGGLVDLGIVPVVHALVMGVRLDMARHDHLGMAACARGHARHGRGHGAPDGEQHGEQDQEPEAEELHGGEVTRVRATGAS